MIKIPARYAKIPSDIRAIESLPKKTRRLVNNATNADDAPRLRESLAFAMMLLDTHAKLRADKGEPDAELEALVHLNHLQMLYQQAGMAGEASLLVEECEIAIFG